MRPSSSQSPAGSTDVHCQGANALREIGYGPWCMTMPVYAATVLFALMAFKPNACLNEMDLAGAGRTTCNP